MTSLTCNPHAEKSRSAPRCERRWGRLKAQAARTEQPLYAVIYEVEIPGYKGWGGAIPTPVNSWRAPKKILDNGLSLSKTYRTGAILDLQGMRAFQESTKVAALGKRNIGTYDALKEREKKLLPAFERLPIPPFQEEPVVIELAGLSDKEGVLSQHAYVIPFFISWQQANNAGELVEETYQQFSSSQ